MAKYFLFDPRFQHERENIKTVIAPCVKHPRNPLTIDGKTDWVPSNGYFSVWRAPESGEYRGIYLQTHLKTIGNMGSYRNMRSADGIEWQSFGNPIFSLAAAAMRDDHDADGLRRYKSVFSAFAFRGKDNGLNELGVFSASSPDALLWNDIRPVELYNKEPGVQFWRPGTPYWTGGDNNPCILYAPTLKKYVALYRTNIDRGPGKRRERSIGRSESADFRKWSPHQLVLRADTTRLKEEGKPIHDIHGMQAWHVGGVYLGILEPYYWSQDDDRMHLELAWSPDTIQWERLCTGTDFVPHPPVGEPDGGCRFPACGVVEEGDEVRIYYGSSPVKFLGPKRDEERISSLFLATFKRDRFAGAAADGAAAGRIVTKVMDSGGELRVNADAGKGRLRVEVRDAKGAPVPGFALADCEPLSGDSPDAIMCWKGGRRLPAGKASFLFELERATIYSFQNVRADDRPY